MNNSYYNKFIRLKTRSYRFIDDFRYHILFEVLGQSQSKDFFEKNEKLHHFIDDLDLSFSAKSPPPPIESIYKITEDGLVLDFKHELQKRLSFTQKEKKGASLQKVIHIVGAPRSGTSYLFNLLSYQKRFAYFTNLSHQAWTTYNLQDASPTSFFENMPIECLSLDTKKLRLSPDVILPAEAENIWENSLSCYTHLGGHQYELHDQIILKNMESLLVNIQSHCSFFNQPNFLSKSPFNSFRMDWLSDATKTDCYFIHIHRNGYSSATSLAENLFLYRKEGDTDFLSAENAWFLFIDKILNYKNRNIKAISLENLITNPRSTLESIFEFLNLEKKGLLTPPTLHQEKWLERSNRDSSFTTYNMELEKRNILLGYPPKETYS